MTGAPDLSWAEQHLRRALSAIPFGGAALAMVAGDDTHLTVLGEASPGRPVTAATPFHVCSCSKTFTAAVLSKLAAEGAFSWDDPIASVIPEFAFADPWVSAHCTFRDLASLRAGVGREGIAEWGYRQDAPKAERLARARHMAVAAPFRDRFAYSNLCYIALSLAAERLAGQAFGRLAETTLFRPLGMADTWSGGFEATPARTPAAPHMPFDGTAAPVDELTGPNSEGSARIHISARDAATWMRFLLAAAAGSDAGPLTAAEVRRMMSPQSVAREGEPRLAPAGGDWAAYGFGLSLTRLRGRRLVRHGGGGRGWRHAMALLPEAGVGVMLMVSAESPRIEGVALEILDRLTGGTGDFADAFQAAAERGAAVERAAAEARFPAGGEGEGMPPAGEFAGPSIGRLCIEETGQGTRFSMPDAPIFTGWLRPLGGGVQEVVFDQPALAAQPLDPLFRLRAVGPDRLETSYWGDLRRVA